MAKQFIIASSVITVIRFGCLSQQDTVTHNATEEDLSGAAAV